MIVRFSFELLLVCNIVPGAEIIDLVSLWTEITAFYTDTNKRGGTVAGIANQRVMPVPTPHAENGVPGVMSSFVSTKSVPI